MTWNKSEIRKARTTSLVPILLKRGYRLRKLEHENFRIEKFGALIVKHHFWIWKEKGLSGNAIDFFIAVEGLSFMQAMEILKRYL